MQLICPQHLPWIMRKKTVNTKMMSLRSHWSSQLTSARAGADPEFDHRGAKKTVPTTLSKTFSPRELSNKYIFHIEVKLESICLQIYITGLLYGSWVVELEIEAIASKHNY
jgi:hypothetical protein